MVSKPKAAFPRAIRAFCIYAGMLAILNGTLSASEDDGVQVVESARSAIEKLVQTRQIISQEKQNWRLSKRMLENRIELVNAEMGTLRTRIEEAQTGVGDAEGNRDELAAERDKRVEAIGALESRIEGFEARTMAILSQLPESIQERMRPISKQLPKDEKAKERMSLSQRYLAVTGVLTLLDKMNREILVGPERHVLSSGAEAEVTVMYVGLGQGYYVTNDETIAAVGTVENGKWTWKDASHAAVDIARSIRMYNNTDAASFVKLPIELN